jgi:hypothetical protein
MLPLGVDVEDRSNPCESFIQPKVWQGILELSTLGHFECLPDDIESNPVPWKKFINQSDFPVPEPYTSSLPEFAQILLHRLMKPEKAKTMIENFIELSLGQTFI